MWKVQENIVAQASSSLHGNDDLVTKNRDRECLRSIKVQLWFESQSSPHGARQILELG